MPGDAVRWRVVPVEPTPDWIAAYMKRMRLTNDANAKLHVRSMLSAAPNAAEDEALVERLGSRYADLILSSRDAYPSPAEVVRMLLRELSGEHHG